MAYENYTVRQFENAMFKDDRSVMNEEEYNIVYTEYIDAADLYETEEFNKVTYIHYLNGRINTIKIGIKLQRDFINNFDVPYLPAFEIFKRNGCNLYWNEDKEEFLRSLERIEMSEKRFVSELENCMKQLIDFRKKNKNDKEPTVKLKRESWIKTINTLGKIGYKIDKDKETVEDLALMIKQQKDENKL